MVKIIALRPLLTLPFGAMNARVLRAILVIFSITFSAVVCCSAQTGDHSHCFQVRVTKDGKSIQSPTVVTFLNKTAMQDADSQDGRFCVPKEMVNEELLDFTFVVAQERLYFPSVSTFRFKADWDVAYGRDARLTGLPKSVNRKKACSVIVRQGEPETEMIVSPCRVPLSTPLHP